ncbi:Type I restriction-modification system, specificity subunit S [Methanosarcina siciliae HI350]|uniref:Type I restriction-modification system, specificity subunit S n=1 Tax=Methanosarcina siciliae HI350 TaxID=1434119 RepID=A0A0E3LA88_9EURY|nr:restriction endonuclease subunit S [Methanosarcina siciliae]AKB31596.1 Type I restriction-modification system, specificity subunit S [Methanosarcina siciliae HI350]
MSTECSAETIPSGYKKTEVGVIPEDWEVDSLIHFWNVTDCKHVTAHFIANGFPVASIKEVQSRFVDLNNAKQTTQQFYNLLIEGGRKPQVDDLILSRNATVGEVAQVAEWHPPFAMGQDVCLLRKKSLEFSTKYLQAVFRSPIIGNQLSNLMVGSTFKRVNVQQIKNFIVPMPAPAEQESIAEALYDTDTLIESLEQLIAKKRKIKQGAMQELLTGKRRLPGFSREWETKTMGNTAVLKARIGWQGLTTNEYLDSGDYYLVTGTEFKDGYIDWGNCHYVTESRYKQDKNIQLKEHDVLVTKDGTIGKVALINHLHKPATLNSGVFVIRPIEDAFYPEFFYYLLCSNIFTEFLVQLSAGSTINHLYQKDFVNFIYKLPAIIEEQISIAAILSDMDSEITALEEKLSKALQIKQGMMQELLTGRIRLV